MVSFAINNLHAGVGTALTSNAILLSQQLMWLLPLCSLCFLQEPLLSQLCLSRQDPTQFPRHLGMAWCVMRRHVSLHVRWPAGLACCPLLLLQPGEAPRLRDPREDPVSRAQCQGSPSWRPTHKGLTSPRHTWPEAGPLIRAAACTASAASGKRGGSGG